MTRKMLRIFTIIGVAILTTGILLGANLVYNKVFWVNPLEASVKEMSAVGDFQIDKLNFKSRVTVQFKGTEKLRSNFYQLLDQLENQKFADSSRLTLEIANQPDEVLQEFLTKARLPVQEAIATGQFTVLPSSLQELAASKEVSFDLEVDNYFVFLTAAKGSVSAHLVINRGGSPLNVLNTMGGEYL